MKKSIIVLYVLALFSSVAITSCSLDTKLSEEVDFDKNPISTFAELEAGINGAYARMKTAEYYGNNIIAFSEVRSQNAYSNNRSNRLGNVSGFTMTPTAAYAVDTWFQAYKVISQANRVIEANYPGMDDKEDMIKGQAYVLRALAHFDLLKNYGEQYVNGQGLKALGVPYIVTYADIEAKVVRPTVEDNRTSIYADFDKGIELLTKSNSGSKVKANLAAAYGLKARAALLFSNWDAEDLQVARNNAELGMSVADGGVVSRSAFRDTFKSDDPQSNSVFEIKFSGTDNPSSDSLYYLYNLTSDGVGYGPILINFSVADLFGADAPIEATEDQEAKEANDIRADITMIGENFKGGGMRNIGKYVKISSNVKILRFEEMLLTFVEADFRINNGVTGEALALLNQLRENRLATYTPVTTYTLDDIRIERQKELMFEGTGFEDAMRFHLDIENPSIATPGFIAYGNPKLAFPIPRTEINVSGIQQNQGYR